jgi:hypothetical protein
VRLHRGRGKRRMESHHELRVLVVLEDAHLLQAVAAGLQEQLASHDVIVECSSGAEEAVALLRERAPTVLVCSESASPLEVLAAAEHEAPAAIRVLLQRPAAPRALRPLVEEHAHVSVPVAVDASGTSEAAADAILACLDQALRAVNPRAPATSPLPPPRPSPRQPPADPLPDLPTTDLSHELGTPLTVLVTSLGLLSKRLAELPRDDQGASEAATDLHGMALQATERLVETLARMRVDSRAPATRATISPRTRLVQFMGDTRFDHHWRSWEDAVFSGRVADYLANEPVEKLVQLLASEPAALDPYARNVLASALANRFRATRSPVEADGDLLWTQLSATRERIAVARALTDASRLLSADSLKAARGVRARGGP